MRIATRNGHQGWGERFTGVVVVMLCLLGPVTTWAAEGFQSTERGALYQDVKSGTGAPAAVGDVATIHFVSWVEQGGEKGRQLFDTRQRGRTVSFVVGTDKVMPGWNEGVIGMRPDGRRLVKVPPDLAYGARGVEDMVPPGAGLIFMIDLVALEKR